MIAASELYPEHQGEFRVRQEDDRWAVMRISGKRSLGERAGTAQWTLFDGWARRLPWDLDEELRFILVPERSMPLSSVMRLVNSANIFAIAFAGLFLWCVLNRSWIALIFAGLLAGYLALVRRVVGKVHLARKRSQERRFKPAYGDALPKWIESQQLVTAGGLEKNRPLLDWLAKLASESLGYEIGLVCAHGSAWLLADDPQGIGPPPEPPAEKLERPDGLTP